MKRLTPLVLAALSAACATDSGTAPDAAQPTTVESTDAFAATAPNNRRIIFGVDESNTLVSFRPNAPQQLLSVSKITGLPSGERIFAIDFRPADGSLLGLGTGSRIYRIDAMTGAATTLGASPFVPMLVGRMLGFDFNPTVDRIRVHTDGEQNLRLHPDLGTVAAEDTALAYDAMDQNAGTNPDVVATAYTGSALNNGVPPTSTVLYAIDHATWALVVLPSPNGGVLRTVGTLGVNFGRAAGFDIATRDDIAFASLNTGGAQTGLYRINLKTGVATHVGDIGHSEIIIGISVQP